MSKIIHGTQNCQSKWFRCAKDTIKNIFEMENGSSLRGLYHNFFTDLRWLGILKVIC